MTTTHSDVIPGASKQTKEGKRRNRSPSASPEPAHRQQPARRAACRQAGDLCIARQGGGVQDRAGQWGGDWERAGRLYGSAQRHRPQQRCQGLQAGRLAGWRGEY